MELYGKNNEFTTRDCNYFYAHQLNLLYFNTIYDKKNYFFFVQKKTQII